MKLGIFRVPTVYKDEVVKRVLISVKRVLISVKQVLISVKQGLNSVKHGQLGTKLSKTWSIRD